MFIGEAPGAFEDSEGFPFIGPAGNLLDRMIEQANTVGATCGFTNTVACIPKNQQKQKIEEPLLDHTESCLPRVKEIVNICKPSLIVCVGTVAKLWLPENFPEREMYHIVHPASILKGAKWERQVKIEKTIGNLCDIFDKLLPF